MGQKASWEDEVDALFQLTPPEFVAARNRLATDLKKAGEAEAANRVKAIPKPSISAWAVNQLYWKHRGAFEKLVATGERFRRAQAARLAGKDSALRATLDERRAVLSETTRLAAEILQRSTGASPVGVMRRVTATLEALSAYGSAEGAPKAGRLVDGVDPPGFESLAALVPRVGGAAQRSAPSRLLAFQKEAAPAKRPTGADKDPSRRRKDLEARIAAAAVAERTAGRTLGAARASAKKAEAALKKAATVAKHTEQQMVAADARLQKAAVRAHATRQRARRAATKAEEAAQSVEDAERVLERATRELRRLVNRD